MQKAMVSSAKSAMVRGKEWTQCKGRKTSYASHHHQISTNGNYHHCHHHHHLWDYHHKSSMRKGGSFVASDDLPIKSFKNVYDK